MTNKKEKLKALFATGKIPFGENFAEFIDDSYNNYKIVDMFNPNQAPSEFEQGVSVLVFNFDPIENPEWDTLFGGDVAPGDIMVRTLRYDGAGVIIQEFDTLRNGRYYPNKSRIALIDDTWGEMQDHPEVRTVNGKKPDDDGNIEVIYDASEHNNQIASWNKLGHVKIDNSTIRINAEGVIRTASPITHFVNDQMLPTDYPSLLFPGTTNTNPPAVHDNPVYVAWDNYVKQLTGVTTNWQTSFNYFIETNRGSSGSNIQTIKVVNTHPDSDVLMVITRRTINVGGFLSPGIEMTTLRGQGSPEGNKVALSGNSYYDYTNKVMYYKTEDGTSSPSNTGWVVYSPKVVKNTFSATDDDDEYVYSAFATKSMLTEIKSSLPDKVKLNRIWDSRPIDRNATTWTVDFSDEEELTDLNNYWFEIYDDGVLVFGNPITNTVNNDNKTVTFTPQTPIPRPFTITCIGRGMEFPQ